MVELSVVIPSYNRAVRLSQCLEALAAQTLPHDQFEVVVVVDGSTDASMRMLSQLSTPYRLRYVWQPNAGQASARNQGAEIADGKYCLFLDDDILADGELLAEHLRAQREHGGVVALGHLDFRLPPRADPFLVQFAKAWSRHYRRLAERVREPSSIDCWGGNISVPRAAVLSIGGFALDMEAIEDVELGFRLQKLGLRIAYVPGAIGHQQYDKDFLSITRDIEKQGSMGVELYRRHPPLLPQMQLGKASEERLWLVLARQVLLALNLPARWLYRPSWLLSRSRWGLAWYRLFASYLYWRGVRSAVADRSTWRQLTRGVPILMYHAIGRPGEPASRFVVPVSRFARQMAYLRKRNYCLLSLGTYVKYVLERRFPPARSVVVTLDDGYADNWDLAFPILRRYDIPATFFLVSGRVGDKNRWDRDTVLAERPLLSWSAARALLAGGMSIGAHTRTHPPLTELAPDQARLEISGSRVELERQLGCQVTTFAYPFGKRDQTSRSLVEQAGYQVACSVRPGLNAPGTPLLELRRTEISGTYSLLRFALAVRFGTAFRLRQQYRS